jgi:hypothetical protein
MAKLTAHETPVPQQSSSEFAGHNSVAINGTSSPTSYGNDMGWLSADKREPFKTLHLHRPGKLRGQELDCNPAVEHQAVREINLTHAAGADQGLNFIMADPASY